MKEEDLKELLAKQHHQSVGQKRKRADEHLPGTFLIHSLTPVHYQILTQQTVWASQNITFRITPSKMICPSFLFAIKGLRTNSIEVVESCIRETWNDKIMTKFVQNGLATMVETEHNSTAHSIWAFMDSMWVEVLETKGQGGLQKPMFNVFMNGKFINNPSTWSNI